MYEEFKEYLRTSVGPTIDGLGAADDRVNQKTEANMVVLFRRYVCGVEGDEGNGYVRIQDDDQLRVYDGRCFRLMPEEALQSIVSEVMESKGVGVVYLVNSAKKIKDAILTGLKAEERCLFTPDRRWVVFENGVLDLETGRLMKFSVKYRTDLVMDFPYEEGARSALWEKVLAQTLPDEGMRGIFQRFCGCFLADRTRYKIEYVLFVVGEGQNGKSVICRAVVNTLGKGVATSYNPDQLFRSGQKDYHLADVNGKVVNYCDEVSNKDFSGGDFKQFVSGGTFIGRHPYSHKSTVVDRIPLMLCCANRIPPTTDDSEGYFRRFLIINAPNKVEDKDKDPMLESKLAAKDVKSAIFWWMLEGYRLFVSEGAKIRLTGSAAEIMKDQRENANSLRRWFNENWVAAEPSGDRVSPYWKPFKEWMNDYLTYCRDWGEMPKGKKAMSDLFRVMGVAKDRRRDGPWFYLEPKVGVDDMTAFVEPREEDAEDDLPY